eukprot:gene21687-34616_t
MGRDAIGKRATAALVGDGGRNLNIQKNESAGRREGQVFCPPNDLQKSCPAWTARVEPLIEGGVVKGSWLASGELLVKGRKCRDVVPWTCEDKLTAQGAKYTKAEVFQAHVAGFALLAPGQGKGAAATCAGD